MKHLLARCLLAVATLATLLTACSGAANDAIPVLNPPVTEGADGAPGLQPIHTPTPEQSPTEALAAARRLIHNGQYEEAIQSFQRLVLDPNAPPQIVADAQFGQGQAALNAGAFGASQAAFDAFLAANASHPQAATATFMRGEARLGTADWAGAIADFEAYLSLRPGLADSYVYERIADAHVALGQTAQAVVAYEQAIAAGREVSSLVALRERLAQIHLNTGNPQGAIDQYEAILTVAQIAFYRAKIEHLLAQAYIAAGNEEEGNKHYLTVINDYPATADAYNALQTLDAGGSISIDPFQRGLVELSAEDYVGASESFYNWLALADPEHPADAHFLLARAYFGLGNPDAALSQYETIIETHENDSAWGQAFVDYADVQASSGNVEGALVTLQGFIDEQPGLPQHSDALYEMARLYEQQGDLERATGFYLRLAADSPGDERALDGLLNAGMDYYRANDLDSAERTFEAMLPDAQGDQLAAAQLWLGRTYLAQGRSDEATSAFGGAAAADPGGYYALRAADLQTGRVPLQAAPAISFDESASAQAEAEAWLASTFALEEAPPYATLRPDLAADVRLVRGQELWGLGMQEEARLEFGSLLDGYAGDPLALYQLAILFRDIGLYRSSISAARSLIILSGQTTLGVPSFVARLSYPTYYRDLVVPAAEQYGLDSLLLFALIRQESRFEGFVTSFALAQGLMQIVPATGQDIADRLGWPDYQNADLYRPQVNVAFGTYYLAQQRDLFGGDLFAGMAAYNAGAGRVSEWQQAWGDDIDVFVERIPFQETYQYVTFTYAQYDIYRELYGVGG